MIGVFDSGLGGLTILQHLLRRLPEHDYLYLGDTARAPYGNRSHDTIYDYTTQALDFLYGRGCNLVIIACNSASAKALRRVQQEYLPRRYPAQRALGVIRPLVEAAAGDPRTRHIGVIGTRATVESGAYIEELRKLNPSLEVTQQAAPLLVPLIEEGWTKRPETKMILRKYLQPLKHRGIDTLIPACTHYPFLLPQIRQIMGRRCNVINPGEIVAEKLADYLVRHPELEPRQTDTPRRTFYTTDTVEKFKDLGSKFLGMRMENVERAEL